MPTTSPSRLATLIAINRQLMDALAPEEMMRRIVEAAIRLLDAEGGSVAISDEAAKQLVFTTVIGNEEARELRLEFGQGILGSVVQSGEPILCNDVSGDPRFFAGVDRRTGFQTRSILCTPLRLHDRVIGALEVLNTANPCGFDADDQELLAAFAGLAAVALERARALSRLASANRALREESDDRYALVEGKSPAMRRVVETARVAAAANTTVLLLGESGVGKEVVARAIHRDSARSQGPFVAVNCVALTPELLESELFGHERGAFTGATAQKKGKFELAHGGTIFLDEIGDLAPNLQAKLLRVLQEREVQRVGGVKDIRVDVRVIAATNRDLERAIAAGDFREDLYYRLNVISFLLPPLRERREDIPVLVERFVRRYARELNRPNVRVSPEAIEVIRNHAWPGNVRELQNAIERAVVLARGEEIGVADLPESVTIRRQIEPAADELDALPLAQALEAFKRRRVEAALDNAGGNLAEAARTLGLHPSNLARLRKTLGSK